MDDKKNANPTQPAPQPAKNIPLSPGGGSYELMPDGTLTKREGTEPRQSQIRHLPVAPKP